MFSIENWYDKPEKSPLKPGCKTIKILQDRRPVALFKYLFFRWLCWTNVIEIFLIVFLAGCCFQQCYEVLQDYFEYPTFVSISKIWNEDFRQDLPAVTICTNNRIAKSALRENFPLLNNSHFVAISQGTFFSEDNFTVSLEPNVDLEDQVHWPSVKKYLVGRNMEADYKVTANYSIFRSITCANMEGVHMPCAKLRQVESFQLHRNCWTLFHDSVLWDRRSEQVRELEEAMRHNPSTALIGSEDPAAVNYSYTGPAEAHEPEESIRARVLARDPLGEASIEMGNSEIVRIRLNLRPDDYADTRLVKGAVLSVHTNSAIGFMRHIVYDLQPGLWYNYYINRFDYKRLPAPYKSNCFDYDANRVVWLDRKKWMNDQSERLSELAHQVIQLASRCTKSADPRDDSHWYDEGPAGEYAASLRNRSLSLVSILCCMHG